MFSSRHNMILRSKSFYTILLLTVLIFGQAVSTVSAQLLPGVTAEKTDVINDNAGGTAGVLEPGETVTYTVVITNTNATPVNKVHFSDQVDTDTTVLSTPAPTTTAGTINILGTNTSVDAAFDIAANSSVTITYTVALDITCGTGSIDVRNQGNISGDILDATDTVIGSYDFFTDDPAVGGTNDVTVTPATDHACATLGDEVFKDVNGNGIKDGTETGVDGFTVNLWTDDDGNGSPDTQVTSTTTSGGGAYSFTGLFSHLDYVLQFVPMATLPFVSQDQGSDDTIDSDVNASGLTGVINLAAGSSNTDFDAGVEDAQTTITADKTDAITGAALDAGDTVTYTIVLTNTSSTVSALKVNFADTLDSNTTLVVGSVSTSAGNVTTGNATGDTSVAVDVDDIPASGTATITFQATLNDVCGITNISSQGNATGNNFTAVVTNDPVTTAANDATSTPVSNPCQASIAGSVWKDDSGNGIRDGSESGQVGVTVELYADSDSDGVADSVTPVDTQTTSASGTYTFTVSDVSTNYVLRFVPMATMPFTTQDSGSDDTIDSDANATSGYTATISVSDGDSITNIDAGLVDAATTVTATKTDAITGSALDAGDTVTYTVVINNSSSTVPALKVNFADTLDTNTTLVVGSVSTTVGSVTTGNTTGDTSVAVNAGDVAADGSVTITFQATLNNVCGITSISNQGAVSGNNFTAVTTDDTATTAANDATSTPVSNPCQATLGDKVWKDANANGLQDTGEAGVDGTTVELYVDADGDGTADTATALATDTTAGGGIYGFTVTDVSQNYVIRFVPMATMPFTTQDSGSDEALDSDANATTGYTSTIAVSDGDAITNIDAGVTDLATATLGDKVFKDTNGNGLQDTGEAGVDGAVVNLWTDDDANGTPDTKTQTFTTINGGMYSFTGLDSTLDYILEFEVMAAMAFTLQDQGTDDAADSDVNSSGLSGVIELAPGETNTSYDAGMITVDTTLTVTKFDVVRNVDSGASDMLEPDESVAYAIQIKNTSNVVATGVVFTDIPDSNTTLQNTVQTSKGTVVIGNTAGDTTIEVTIGDIAPDEEVIIQFNAQLNNPIPATVTEIKNQGTVDGSNIPVILTDDPNTGEAGDATATPVSDPRIGLAKAVVGTPTSNADGSHTVVYEMTVSNMGNRPLNSLQITDDLGATFVGGPSIVSSTVSSTTLATNDNYNGLTDTNLLAGTDSLAVEASATLTLTVTVNLNSASLGAYENSAFASGTSPESVTVSDQSQNGSSVDSDSNGNPYDNNDKTPVTFEAQAVVASIALAKAATLTTDVDANGNSVYRVIYDFVVSNDSSVALDGIQVTDDLVAAMDGLSYGLIGTSSSSNLTVNPSFNGNSDKNLLSGEDTLAAGISGTIKLELSIPVAQITAEKALLNTATVLATAPEDTGVSDVSQTGTNPDPEGNGAGDNSDPTVVRLEPDTTTPTIPTTPTTPASDQKVRVQKVVLTTEYEIGSAIIYRITLINDSTTGVATIDITDTPSQFLRYVPNSTEVRVSGVTEVQSLEPSVTEGILSWNDVVVPAAGEGNLGSGQVEITYKMRVLPGASGKLRNSATVISDGAPVDAAVNVNADIIPGGAGPFSGLPTGTVIGRVFADVNGDRQYTAGVDQPIGGARLILCNGWQVRTDVEGNYTFREVPQGTDCVQLDKHSIPFEVDKGNLSSGSGYVQMMQSFGVSTNNFVLKVGTGEVKAVRETTVVYGPVTVLKRHLPLENGNIRVVLDVDVSETLPYGIIITDRIPDAAQPTVWDLMTTRTFELGLEAKQYVFDYELPANAPMTDLELAPNLENTSSSVGHVQPTATETSSSQVITLETMDSSAATSTATAGTVESMTNNVVTTVVTTEPTNTEANTIELMIPVPSMDDDTTATDSEGSK